MTELQKMNDAELIKYVSEKREELRKTRFGASGSRMRDTHAIRDTRKEIARGLTEIGMRSRKAVTNEA